MIKRSCIIFFCCLISFNSVFSIWRMGKIVNNSDLIFQAAWHSNTKVVHGGPKRIKVLTDVLSGKHKGTVTFPKPYKVGSGAGSCYMITCENGYRFMLDDMSTRDLKSQRLVGLYASVGKDVDENKYPYLARIFLEREQEPKAGTPPVQLKAYGTYGYGLKDTPVLDITISGADGLYKITLAVAH